MPRAGHAHALHPRGIRLFRLGHHRAWQPRIRSTLRATPPARRQHQRSGRRRPARSAARCAGPCDLALHSSHLRTRAVRRAQRQYVSTCAGLLGQSFSGDGKRDGKRDVYPAAGRFTTSAMAEGAIEGTAAMYEVASPHATDFAFSRFDAKPQQADAKPQQPSSSGEAVPMDASAESD